MSAVSAGLRRSVRNAWRHRWTFGVPIASLLLPAALYAVSLPDVYDAAALVELRSVRPENVGAGAALPQRSEARLEHVVASARNRLLTQRNVAAIVPILAPGKAAEDGRAIAGARGRVDFDQVGEGAFTVSVEDPDPARAAAAVNALLDSFLESERAELLEPARMRAEFMEREAEKARAQFASARDRFEEFRARHPDTMPDQKDAVLERLRRLEAAARDRETLAGTSRRLAQEYERLLRQAPREDRTARAASTEEVQLDLQLRGSQTALDQARQEIVAARAKYTERHPALQQLLGEVESLEGAVSRTREELKTARARAEEQALERRAVEGRDWIESLDRMRGGAQAEAKEASAEAQGLRDEMDALQARLAAMPAVETALRPLRLGYDEAAKVKEDRERDARNARSAVDFYAQTDAADFTGFDVKERATAPATPSGPQRWRFLAVAAGAGALLGYLLLALRRRFREKTVAAPADLEAILPAALVVSVPLLEREGRRRRHVVREAALAGYVVVLLAGTAFALAARTGAVPVPEWARPLLGRLGGGA